MTDCHESRAIGTDPEGPGANGVGWWCRWVRRTGREVLRRGPEGDVARYWSWRWLRIRGIPPFFAGGLDCRVPAMRVMWLWARESSTTPGYGSWGGCGLGVR